MKQIGIIGSGLLAGLLLSSLIGCDAPTAPHQEFASAIQTANRAVTPGGLSKAYSEAELSIATTSDLDGNVYTATYNPDKSGYADGQTVFAYDLAIGSLSGFHFALQIPQCAFESFAYSDPNGNWNGNPNGNLEFGPEDFKSTNVTVYVAFDGEVSLGVIFASFKYSGSGELPDQKPILGPCQKADYWIRGKVFLDDPAAGTFGVQDPNEPGIGGVEVALFEFDGTPNQGEATQLTAADGSYAFHVLGPPVFDPVYQVRLLASGAGLNAQLFDPAGFWMLSDTAVRDVNLSVSSTAAPIGFWLDIDKAIRIFEDPALSETDMLPREFWRVQVTGKGTKKYKPVVPDATLDVYMAAIASFSDHIPYVFPEGISRETASDILQTASKNDPQMELKTLSLAALFNFVSGRGACATLELTDPDPGDPIGFPVCVEPDAESTRLIIEQALVEWMRNEGLELPSVGKESGGSMSRVLGAMM